jgi:hypothetical protein
MGHDVSAMMLPRPDPHKGRVQQAMHCTQGNLEQFNIILALNKEDLLVRPQNSQQLLRRTTNEQLQEM